MAPSQGDDDLFHVVLILALPFGRAGPAPVARMNILSGQGDKLRLDSLLPEDFQRVLDGKSRVTVIVQTAGNPKDVHRFPSRTTGCAGKHRYAFPARSILGNPDDVSII
jgi:hypothetical protein